MHKILDKAIRMCDVSNVEKDKNFREFDKKVMKVAENGTLEDLVSVRREVNRIYENGGFKKSDYSILMKHDLYAERQVLRRKKV